MGTLNSTNRGGFVEDQESQKEDLFFEAVELYSEEKFEESIACYKRALELDPGYSDVLHGLARAQFDSGDADAAISTAKRLTEIDADDILAHTSLSMFYQAKGMIEEAEKEGNVARILGWKQELKKDAD